MRAFAALAIFVSLTNGSFGQEAREKQPQDHLRQSLATGDYIGAERTLRQWIASGNPTPEEITGLRATLGDLLREEGRYEEARQLFNSVMREPAISPRLRMTALMGLATSDAETGNWQASIAGWNEVLATARARHDTFAEGGGLRGMAMMWMNKGEPSRAEPLLQRSLHVLESAPDSPPWHVAATLTLMGELYRAADKLALAEDSFSRALALERKSFGDSNPQVAYIMGDLAEVYARRGESTLAGEYSARVVDVMRNSCGGESIAFAAALANYAAVHQLAGDPETAAASYARALNILRGHPENRRLEVIILQRYAGLLKATHRKREAKALTLEAKSFSR